MSVAVAVGFIALFGMAIETAMLMTIYLNEAMQDLVDKEWKFCGKNKLCGYTAGSYQRSCKTSAAKDNDCFSFIFGLFPVLWATGAGSDVMLPITLPLIGGLSNLNDLCSACNPGNF